jgi:ubiquitin carboxyl-terminal hydrolase L3
MRHDWPLARSQQRLCASTHQSVLTTRQHSFQGHETNDRPSIAADTDLAKLVHEAEPLGPVERANLLYESDALEAAHQSAAAQGESAAPAADDSIDLHYVCFVKSDDNKLWELDGRRKGPLERGTLSADEDVLSDKALQLGVRSFLKREEEAGGGELRFSLIVLAPTLD